MLGSIMTEHRWSSPVWWARVIIHPKQECALWVRRTSDALILLHGGRKCSFVKYIEYLMGFRLFILEKKLMLNAFIKYYYGLCLKRDWHIFSLLPFCCDKNLDYKWAYFLGNLGKIRWPIAFCFRPWSSCVVLRALTFLHFLINLLENCWANYYHF